MYATAVLQWEDGLRRLGEAPERQRIALELVHDRIVAELRKRLGGRFTTDELAELYTQGTDWCLQLAVESVPDAPYAWDPAVADAAFGTYLREASDYAGGRRRGP
ncbi:MAG TPA: hypothetical protein VHR88_00610 [Solirubrobacteraceae bacterium]|nr:hypothetical protein [Solirubrobacteraceae bacterium]